MNCGKNTGSDSFAKLIKRTNKSHSWYIFSVFHSSDAINPLFYSIDTIIMYFSVDLNSQEKNYN